VKLGLRLIALGAAFWLAAVPLSPLPAAAENTPGVASSDKMSPPAESPAYPSYNARAEIERYAQVAYESYQATAAAAHELQDAVTALLDEPSAATLAAARGAWLKARAAYMATEVFRFYGGPIDRVGVRIDPWPIDEGFIDGVPGHQDGGLIGNPKVAITRQTLAQPPGGPDPSHAATGFHVIEFLLWGQDKNPGAERSRRAVEFQLGGPHHAERRRLFLQTATKLLVEDLDQLTAAWSPRQPGNYAAQFLALDQREALGRMLSGMAILADQAIARQRLMGVLNRQVRVSPLARYSLHTNDDLNADLDGIRILWTGDDRQSDGAGLDGLVQALDPALAQGMERRLAGAQTAVRMLDKPFDQLLRAAPGSGGWKHATAAAKAFHRLATTIEAIGKLLAVKVPTSAS
jgi:putative iron-regulated protein